MKDEETKIVLLRRPQVQQRVNLSRSTLYRLISDGLFPKPVDLGPRAVGWVEHEIDAWIKSRIEQRDK